MKPRRNLFHVRKDSPSLTPRLSGLMVGLGVSGLFVMTASAVAPVAYDDLIIGKADAQLTLDYLLLNDKDADGNTLSITATTNPAHGVLTALGGNSYRYTPTAGYVGRDSFTYTVSDGTGGTDTALVNISVNAAYDVTVARDTILSGVAQLADVTGNRMVYAWGTTAASITNFPGQDEDQAMVAAATMGQGRVVAMSDPAWLNMNTLGGQYTTAAFYKNSISWISNTTSKTIPIVTLTSEASTWLTAQGYTNVTLTTESGLAAALTGKTALVGYIPRSLSASNITAVKNFVSAGGGLFCCEGTYQDNATATILREAGIFFDPGSKDDFEPPFTINRADDLVTTDVIVAMLKNSSGYTPAQKVTAMKVAQRVINKLPADDSERARLLGAVKVNFGTFIPTPQAPVTDVIQRFVLDMECAQINALPPAQMTAHPAALPVSAAAPRVANATFGLVPPVAAHSTKTIYTPYYAAPGELVTIQFPAALLGKNLDVRVGHLRSAQSDTTSYPVMPVQILNFDVTTAQLQVASPHGGLIQIIVPDNTTWTGTQNITVTGAVEAPFFKLGTTTDAQWTAGLRDRGTPFGVLDSPEASLVVDADKWLRTLADPTAVMTEWNYFCGKLREFYVYNPGRQLPVHHDFYPAGGVSTYPQSYNLTDNITSSRDLQSSGYSLTLHEYGHICDSDNLLFNNFGETNPNMGGKWIQDTERKYSWKQELVVGRVNNYIAAQSDDLWTPEAHHAVDWKGTPFDVLSAEFGPTMMQQTVAAISALPAIGSSQGKIDEWARQLSNRSGFNLCAFLATWQINVSPAVQAELASKPNWMPVERAPESLTVAQNTPVIFVDPSSNDFSYDGGLTLTNVSQPGSGAIANNGNGTYTYTPAAGFTGGTSFTYTVTNTTGNTFTTTVPVKVVAAANDPKLAAFDGVAKGGTWTTITLPKTYNSMVVVAQPAVAAGAPPMVARIRNASGSSFEVRLDRLDGSATPVNLTSVRFLVVEEGVYNQTTHGIKMEAVKFTSSSTDRAGAFTGTTRDFAYTRYDHYFVPAVFGQVMSANDDRWSAFWYDASANSVQLGKHVGEDTVTTRANETIGYIVMESGSYQFGNDQIQVGLTNVDAYAGFNLINESVSSVDFARFPTLHSAQVSASIEVPWGGSDPGKDGFVTMQKLAGGNGLSAYLAEDSIGDAETATGDKSCAYLIAHHSDGSPVAHADSLAALSGKATLIKPLANDDISGSSAIQVTQQPANGVVTVHTDGSLIYTSNVGFTGSDVFAYTVTNAQGSSSSLVNLQVEATGTSVAGIKADRFNNITGGSISNLTGSANYPANPSTSTIWTTVNSGQNVGDNLGHHIYGYVVAPTTGNYTFWISSDDQSQLFLSPDASSANKKQIASVNGYTDYQNWDQTGSQKSVVIPLQAGRAYYMEVLHKEAGGGDHVSVAWQGPGFARKLLANPDIFTAGNSAPTLVAAPANTSTNEGTPKVVNLTGVFGSADPADPLTIEVHGNSRPDLVSTSLVGNTLTLSQVGLETGSAVITLRATDRTNTLVTTSFTITINDSIADSDGDGLTDSWEVQHFGTIAAQNGSGDPDGDGMNNAAELAAGTLPGDADSDDDGYNDGFEGIAGSNPNSTGSTPQGLYANLRGWWKLDEGSGSTADDSTGRAQDGTLASGTTWTTGLNSGAVALNGPNQAVEIPALNLNSNTVTISGWVKRSGTQTAWSGLVFSRAGAASGLNLGSANDLRYHWNDAANTYGFASNLTLPDNTWTFCALVVEPTKATLYMQPAGGTMQTAVNNVSHATSAFSGISYIGRDPTGGRDFKGSLDEVRVYGRALGSVEIGQLYESANPPHAPVFTADPTVMAAATEDAAYTGSLAGSATDADGGSLTYSKVSGPAWLTVAPNGALTGTPGNGNVGANDFIVRATDPSGFIDEVTLSISVTNTNDAPAFALDTINGGNATEDVAYTGSLAGTTSDIDAGDTATYSKVSGAPWLNVAPNGTITGTPGNGDVGPNSVIVRVTDSGGLSDDAVFNVTVINVNDAPVFAASPLNGGNATQGAAYTGSLAGAASDVDAGDTRTYSKVSGSPWLNVAPNGTLTGTPGNGNVGANSFTVRVTDAGGLSDDAVFNVNVANVNDAPVFTAHTINLNATEDSAFTGQLVATDPDAGETLVYTKVSGPGWLTVSGSGALSGTPTNGDVGVKSFVVRVTDGSGATDEATLNVTVANVNDAPVFTVDPIIAAGGTVGTAYTGQTLAGSATDADAGDVPTYSKVSGPAWLSVAANGTLSGTPPSGSGGLNTFVVRATDSSSATDDAVLRINVVGLPSPWVNADIGTGMLAGSVTHNAGVFTVAGSGALGGTTDKLQFVYQTLSGDGKIIARVSSLQNTGTASRVGVMMRDNLTPNSRQAFFGLSGTGTYMWERRFSSSNINVNGGTGTVPNTWVRLERVGGMITASKSSDGVNWTVVTSGTVTMATNCYIGLAVSSGSNTTLNTSQISDVSVTP